MKKIVLYIFLLVCLHTVAQDTKIRLFGQPTFSYADTSYKTDDNYALYVGKSYKSRSTNLNEGGLVLFITSQITEKISALAEAKFTYFNNIKTFGVDLSRIFLRYYLNDNVSFRVGKMYIPLGYWNNQYNMGLVLQPTIFRPFQIRPANEGGLVQTRDVGFQIEGENISKLRFFYRFMVGNGSGYYGYNDKVDYNKLAFTANVGIEPIDGLKILISGKSDNIRKGSIKLNGNKNEDNGKQYLLNASIGHMVANKKLELIGEFYNNFSVYDSIGTRKSIGYFVYGGYKITNNFIPYAMFNQSISGKDKEPDLLFAQSANLTINQIIIGARYKFNANFIIKAEYLNQYEIDHVPLGPVNTDITTKTNQVNLQFAFAF